MTAVLELGAEGVAALRDDAVPLRRALEAAGTDAPAWLAGAAAALRAPRFRLWTEGEAPAAEVCGGRPCALLIEPGTLVGLDVTEIAMALWGVLGLGPRPIVTATPLVLTPGAMALLIGRGVARDLGVAPERAAALQRVLDAGTRHWSVRLACGTLRRNLEVLDGDAGLFRIRPVPEGVELAPVSATALLRELVALVASAAEEPTGG